MNKQTTVVLADAARARIFTVETKRGQGGRDEPSLCEHVDLIQSGRRARPAEQLSESRPGTRRGGGSEHAVDDHRDARTEEADRKFAGEVVREIGTFCGKHASDRLLVVAPPRFLGHLKSREFSGGQEVSYVGLDISDFTASKALDHLTRHGHLKIDDN